MSLLKFLIGWHPAFSRWKFAHRSSSSSGDSFIRSARVSPSRSNAANAVEAWWKSHVTWKLKPYSRRTDSAPHLRFGWARCQQTARSWWSATGGRAPGEAFPPSGPTRRCLPHGSRWQRLSSGPGSGSPVRYRTSVRPCRGRCNDPNLLWTYLTCIVNVVLFFLLMVLSSMVSGTDRLIILLCKHPNRFTHKSSKKKKKKDGRKEGRCSWVGMWPRINCHTLFRPS